MSSSSPFEVNDDDDDDEDALHQRNNCRYKVLVMRLLTVPEEEEELLLLFSFLVVERNRKDVLAAVVIVVLFLVMKKKTRLDDPRPKTQNVMFRRDIYGILQGGREKSQANKQTKQTTTRAIRCCPGCCVRYGGRDVRTTSCPERRRVGWLAGYVVTRSLVYTVAT
eukprot:scaffold30312_cov107-Amphora_coffeaeformis.AAC.1